MEELKLYKLITESDYVESYRWNETDFAVWIRYLWLDDFIEKLIEIFGKSMFDEGGVEARLFSDYLYINLCDLVDGYVDLEEIFPRSDEEV